MKTILFKEIMPLIVALTLTNCAKEPPVHTSWQEAPSYNGLWLGRISAEDMRQELRNGPLMMTLDQQALRNLLPYDKAPYGGSTFLVESARGDRLTVKRIMTGVSNDGVPSVDAHEFSIRYLLGYNPQFYRTSYHSGRNHTFKNIN
jgi:hypothetical protein